MDYFACSNFGSFWDYTMHYAGPPGHKPGCSYVLGLRQGCPCLFWQTPRIIGCRVSVSRVLGKLAAEEHQGEASRFIAGDQFILERGSKTVGQDFNTGDYIKIHPFCICFNRKRAILRLSLGKFNNDSLPFTK